MRTGWTGAPASSAAWNTARRKRPWARPHQVEPSGKAMTRAPARSAAGHLAHGAGQRAQPVALQEEGAAAGRDGRARASAGPRSWPASGPGSTAAISGMSSQEMWLATTSEPPPGRTARPTTPQPYAEGPDHRPAPAAGRPLPGTGCRAARAGTASHAGRAAGRRARPRSRRSAGRPRERRPAAGPCRGRRSRSGCRARWAARRSSHRGEREEVPQIARVGPAQREQHVQVGDAEVGVVGGLAADPGAEAQIAAQQRRAVRCGRRGGRRCRGSRAVRGDPVLLGGEVLVRTRVPGGRGEGAAVGERDRAAAGQPVVPVRVM